MQEIKKLADLIQQYACNIERYLSNGGSNLHVVYTELENIKDTAETIEELSK
jgi:hypothetical protein